MGDIALHGPELKKFVKLAKKRDLNFAYCPGNDPKEDVFVLDRKKNPEVIGRVARGEGTGTKAAIGTARVKGRVMMLTCLKEVPQAAKKLKKFLKFEKVPMNIVIMDKDGNVLEEDIEDLPEDPDWDADDANDDDTDEESNAVAASEEEDLNQQDGVNDTDAERLKKLTARAAKLKGSIAALSDPYKSAMINGFKPIVGILQSGNLDAADTVLTNLEKAFSKMPGDLGPLRKQAEALKQRIDALGNAEVESRLLAAHGLLVKQIEAGNAKKATGTAKTLSDAIARAETLDVDQNAQGQEDDDTNEDTDAQAAKQSNAEKDIPAGVLPYVRARLDWIQTRATLKSELTKLKRAILEICDKDEFPGIESDADKLFSYISGLDGQLEDALEALVEAPDGDEREKLKAAAVTVLQKFQRQLDTPFFRAVDADNGFTQVNVLGAASESLDKVRDALAA